MTTKSTPPYQVWNAAVDMSGFGRRASASDGAAALKRLRGEIGEKEFDAAFRLRMATARAETLEELLENWAHERTVIGV